MVMWINTYNKIPFVDKNPDPNAYATEMAMQGLFSMIAVEEKKIREESRLSAPPELLKKVFSNNNKSLPCHYLKTSACIDESH